MILHHHFIAFSLLAVFFLSEGCSTGVQRLPSSSQNETAPLGAIQISEEFRKKAEDSSVEIHYILGRDHYHLLLEARGELVTANARLDRETLEKGNIPFNRYPSFLYKANNFIDQYQKPPADSAPCRNPFMVTVRLGAESKSVRGCRSQDGGAISKLVHDGEFLLYSKN